MRDGAFQLSTRLSGGQVSHRTVGCEAKLRLGAVPCGFQPGIASGARILEGSDLTGTDFEVYFVGEKRLLECHEAMRCKELPSSGQVACFMYRFTGPLIHGPHRMDDGKLLDAQRITASSVWQPP